MDVSDGYDFQYSDDDGSQDDDYFNTAAELEDKGRRAQYAIYSDAELRERFAALVADLVPVLDITEPIAVRLLRLYKWDANRATEEWFADTNKVKAKMGMDVDAVVDAVPKRVRSSKAKCMVCFESFPPAEMLSAPCRHLLCKDCWAGYISAGIQGGQSVLELRCPHPTCTSAVPWSIFTEISTPPQLAKLSNFVLRSFVEDSPALAWCPAPGCEAVVECTRELGPEPLDVSCSCGAAFCFTCKEEAHRPVDCGTVAKWIRKNSAESENLNWILANTKPCPKCKRPIEKNQGCMHMNCSQCKFEFCWLCLSPWTEHNEATGGFYGCNRYEAGKKEGMYSVEEAKREHAKHSLERYMHYFQRWSENDKSRLAAQAKIRELPGGKLESLSEITATPSSQLKFISEAWEQVVQCRRILKWTYAYGFYSFQDEGSEGAALPDKQQQEFFEYTQGQAEGYLERLHKMVETDLNLFLEHGKDQEDWPKFRENLIGLTDVTRLHFGKLVEALEEGLNFMLNDYQKVVVEAADDAAGDEEEEETEAGPSTDKKGPAKKQKPLRGRGAKRLRPAAGAAAAAAAAADAAVDAADVEEEAVHWTCQTCTFVNTDMESDTCEVCEEGRNP